MPISRRQAITAAAAAGIATAPLTLSAAPARRRTRLAVSSYSYWHFKGDKVPMENAWPMGLLVLGASIAVAYGSLKLYDIPVRKWLSNRFIAHVNKR